MRKRTFSLIGLGLVGSLFTWSLYVRRSRCLQSFKDQVVIITGGSRGLGLILAKDFAAEGAHVCIIARDIDELRRAEQQINPYGPASLSLFAADIRQEEEVGEVFEMIGRRYGKMVLPIHLTIFLFRRG